MLWEVEIQPAPGRPDREGSRVLQECRDFGAETVRELRSARSFLIQTDAGRDQIERMARELLVDRVVETDRIHSLSGDKPTGRDPWASEEDSQLLNVLFKPGVTDHVAESTKTALSDLGFDVEAVATCRKYRFNADADRTELERMARRVLANEAIEQVVPGPLQMESLSLGSPYEFELLTVPIREMDDDRLMELSRSGQLFLTLEEMRTIRGHFIEEGRDPTDAELETLAQTWSEHCSHKTLTGRIRYREIAPPYEGGAWGGGSDAPRATPPESPPSQGGEPVSSAVAGGERLFENMLKETIFAATQTIRKQLGPDDWCLSVFKDNAGIVKFDERQGVCFKVETHNHPSAIEPYGGANTGLGGVIRDPLGTGLGAKPVCNTDVFCFAPPDVPDDQLPPGVLHPRVVMRGVVSGVRDYGNRMGIPTVNGAIYFDERYLGNPLVYCGNVAMIPADKTEKHMRPGDLIVTVGGRTGRDGIHGATFSSAELTHESETVSGGAVQIGNPIVEKMMMDVILEARDRDLFSAITDCGAGGFSSAVGEMGAETGAEVWLEKAPLKYAGLSYTEIWISESQERMVLAVPPENWDEFHSLCAAEGVEATVIGRFTDTRRLILKYHDRQVGDLSMEFLHEGRPPVVREAIYRRSEEPKAHGPRPVGLRKRFDDDLKQILASLNVCSKEWVIRQYDHEVQAGSVIKPLVGVQDDGPSDAAVVRPDLRSRRGLVVACGMNPRYGDIDPYWMAASAIDEAVRNCVAVGADPARIAVLDNFCWGNTERPETLGSLVRAALGCHDVAVAYRTPFISGKDSLNNEFSYIDDNGTRRTVSIPPSLLISALGQIEDIERAVTMDLKAAGNLVYLVGATHDEFGGSHFEMLRESPRVATRGLAVPRVDPQRAPQIFAAVHRAIREQLIRSCHDLSEGGLAVAAAETAFAGGLGLELNLAPLAEQSSIEDDAVLLFSESNTRFLAEVRPEDQTAFESILDGLPLVRLGRVTGADQVLIRGTTGTAVVDSRWSGLKDAWTHPLAWN